MFRHSTSPVTKKAETSSNIKGLPTLNIIQLFYFLIKQKQGSRHDLNIFMHRGTIKGRSMIKGRGMIKGRHLALYQIFKTTVFTTKYMINKY
jgi:hypothetical protein